jgi:hypothetical protein
MSNLNAIGLCAGLAGFAGIFWLVLGVSYFANCVLILRRAETE